MGYYQLCKTRLTIPSLEQKLLAINVGVDCRPFWREMMEIIGVCWCYQPLRDRYRGMEWRDKDSFTGGLNIHRHVCEALSQASWIEVYPWWSTWERAICWFSVRVSHFKKAMPQSQICHDIASWTALFGVLSNRVSRFQYIKLAIFPYILHHFA